MTPGHLDLIIYRGIAYRSPHLVVTDLDLSGYTAKSQIKASSNSHEIIAEFEVSVETDGEDNYIALELSAEIASTLTTSDHYVWDILIKSQDGEPEPFISGCVRVKNTVTEWEWP